MAPQPNDVDRLISFHPAVKKAMTSLYEIFGMIDELWTSLNHLRSVIFPVNPAAMVRGGMESGLVEQLLQLDKIHNALNSELMVRRGFCIAGHSSIVGLLKNAEAELDEWRTPLRREALVCQLFGRIFDKAPSRLHEFYTLTSCNLQVLRGFIDTRASYQYLRTLNHMYYSKLSRKELKVLIDKNRDKERALVCAIRKQLSRSNGLLKEEFALLSDTNRSELQRLMAEANLLHGGRTPNLDQLCYGRMARLSKKLEVSHLPPCQPLCKIE